MIERLQPNVPVYVFISPVNDEITGWIPIGHDERDNNSIVRERMASGEQILGVFSLKEVQGKLRQQIKEAKASLSPYNQ